MWHMECINISINNQEDTHYCKLMTQIWNGWMKVIETNVSKEKQVKRREKVSGQMGKSNH